MNKPVFIKSFSQGQITIPKKIRDSMGLTSDFWLKVSIDKGKIVAEPVEEERTSKDYPQKLLAIKGDWFSQKEWQDTRSEVEERLKKLHGESSS